MGLLRALALGCLLSTAAWADGVGATCVTQQQYEALKSRHLKSGCFAKVAANYCVKPECGDGVEADLDGDGKPDKAYKFLVTRTSKKVGAIDVWHIFVFLSSHPGVFEIEPNAYTSLPDPQFLRLGDAAEYDRAWAGKKALVVGPEDIYSAYAYDRKKQKFVMIFQIVD